MSYDYDAYSGDATVVVLDNDKAAAVSQGGGKHVTLTLTEEQGGEITSGDLVICEELVGVAMTDWDAATGTVVIDIDHAYYFEVEGVDADGDAELPVGSWVYYDAVNTALTGVINSANRPVGIILQGVPEGVTRTVLVLIKQCPWAAITELIS